MERKDLRNGNAKLDEEDVRHIRWLLRTGQASPREIAKARGLAVETVRRIERRETWGWLSDETTAPPASGAEESLARVLAGLAEQPAETREPVARVESAVERMARTAAEIREREGRGDKLLDELKGEGNG